jgi:putative ABC transport system ATP-binding protein
MTDGRLVAEGLWRAFGPNDALRGASITVEPGEVVAVRGRSGSGKSTLLQCLGGVILPDDGSVHLGGACVDRLDDEERSRLRRTAFGFVFQFARLVPDLSALDNVALPLLLDRRGAAAGRRAAGDWLARLGVAETADRPAGSLSGGQQQRVAIARALVHAPSVVLADEPTGALDSVAADEVMALLVEETRGRGASLVLVTHDARVAAYADREVEIRDGVL